MPQQNYAAKNFSRQQSTANTIEKRFLLQNTVEDSIVMSLLKIADTLTKTADLHCQRFGVTSQQWLILLHLANDPNIPYIQEHAPFQTMVATDLAAALNVSRPNITNLLNILLDKKLINQQVNQQDMRRKTLVLTDKGIELLRKMEPLRRRANSCVLAHLSLIEKVVFEENLRGCLEALHPER